MEWALKVFCKRSVERHSASRKRKCEQDLGEDVTSSRPLPSASVVLRSTGGNGGFLSDTAVSGTEFIAPKVQHDPMRENQESSPGDALLNLDVGQIKTVLSCAHTRNDQERVFLSGGP